MTTEETTPTAQIDAILATLPEAMATALAALRRTIAAAAPEAEEAIGYGVPAFKYRGRPLVSFGAAKNHGSFYVQSPGVMDAHRSLLVGLDTSTGTVRFTPDKPLSADLVTALVRARLAETDQATKK